jgi:hypothetical protein
MVIRFWAARSAAGLGARLDMAEGMLIRESLEGGSQDQYDLVVLFGDDPNGLPLNSSLMGRLSCVLGG